MRKAILESSSGKKMPIHVGQIVGWQARGLNRHLVGKILSIQNPHKYKNPNEYSIKVKLKSGAIVTTRGWQLL